MQLEQINELVEKTDTESLEFKIHMNQVTKFIKRLSERKFRHIDIRERQEKKEQTSEEADQIPNSIRREFDQPNLMDVSVEKYLTRFSTTEENLLWKRRCVALMPSLSTVTNDHLYCYHKMFLQQSKLQVPLFYQTPEVRHISQQVEKLQSLLITPLELLTKNGPHQSLNSSEETFDNHCRFIQAQMRKLADNFDRLIDNHKLVELNNRARESRPLFPDHEPIMSFLKDTAYVRLTSTSDPDPLPETFEDITLTFENKTRLLSPINGRSVTISVYWMINGDRYEGSLDPSDTNLCSSIIYHDMTGKQVLNQDVDLEYIISYLWQAVKFLGLTSHLSVNADIVSKVKLVHRIWDELVVQPLLNNSGDSLTHCIHELSLGFPLVENKTELPMEVFIETKKYMIQYSAKVRIMASTLKLD